MRHIARFALALGVGSVGLALIAELLRQADYIAHALLRQPVVSPGANLARFVARREPQGISRGPGASYAYSKVGSPIRGVIGPPRSDDPLAVHENRAGGHVLDVRRGLLDVTANPTARRCSLAGTSRQKGTAQ
jgi:hypothetical protein